ncbi:MAG TPA: Gfo/Idh/MocA family oxidoreductase, partial [bacterium]|nr:Gfo/Idh/MocA family oxidoreductase [bacterium]
MKAGIIGLGMGRQHLLGYLQNNIEVAGICDIDQSLLKNVQYEFHIRMATADYQELLAEKDIDIIS